MRDFFVRTLNGVLCIRMLFHYSYIFKKRGKYQKLYDDIQQLFREKKISNSKSTTARCQRLSANARTYNTKSIGMSKNNVLVYDKNDKDFLNYAVILKKVSDD